MNSEFKVFKLGNVATIFAGGDKPQAFSEAKNDEFKIPVYANGETNEGLQGYTNKAKVNEPAVTVSARGTIGYAVLRKEPFVPIVRLLTLIPNKDLLDIGFLYYYLRLYRQKGIGSSQAQLIAPELSKRTISIPLLPTQKSISKVLSDLDAKIELNNKINQELEAMAKTLYDYWFVQFDFPCLPSDYSPVRCANSGRPSVQVNPNSDLAQKIIAFSTYNKVGGLPLPDGKKWFVYVILCEDGSLYKGLTNDLYRRFYEHYNGQGADWTKTHKPKKIIHWEQFNTQDEARKREEELKTGFGRTWLQREYDKFIKYGYYTSDGLPAHQTRLMPAGKMVYNEELKREIPEGWEYGTLGDIAELVRGVTYDASEIKKENDCDVIPVLRATNISGNMIDLNNMVFVPKQNVSHSQVLNKFDILITMSSGSKDHIGKNGFFYFDKEVAFGAFCAKIVAKNKYRFYVYSYTQSDFMFSTIKNECLGTNINNLNGSLVKGFKLVIPPNDLVKKFNGKVFSIYEMIGNNHKQNQQLTELRDWLLPMLMNGQVTVGEVEEKLSMAAEPQAEYKKG